MHEGIGVHDLDRRGEISGVTLAIGGLEGTEQEDPAHPLPLAEQAVANGVGYGRRDVAQVPIAEAGECLPDSRAIGSEAGDDLTRRHRMPRHRVRHRRAR